jgi:hypothetical protein
MLSYGLQTLDFMKRLEKYEGELPPLLLQLARLMFRLIQEIEKPQLDDILRLQGQLREIMGTPDRLLEACGREGSLCQHCPFGAYLPSGFPYACEEKPVCLPWIVLVHPQPTQSSSVGESS